MARECGISKVTVYDIKQNEKNIKSYAATMESLSLGKNLKIMRMAQDDKLDEALYISGLCRRDTKVCMLVAPFCVKRQHNCII